MGKNKTKKMKMDKLTPRSIGKHPGVCRVCLKELYSLHMFLAFAIDRLLSLFDNRPMDKRVVFTLCVSFAK